MMTHVHKVPRIFLAVALSIITAFEPYLERKDNSMIFALQG
jgi:hypothetical protein